MWAALGVRLREAQWQPESRGHWGEGLVLSLPHTLLAGEQNPEPRPAALSQLRPAGSFLSLSAIRHIPASSGLFLHDIWLLRRLLSACFSCSASDLVVDSSPLTGHFFSLGLGDFAHHQWLIGRLAGVGGENQGRI